MLTVTVAMQAENFVHKLRWKRGSLQGEAGLSLSGYSARRDAAHRDTVIAIGYLHEIWALGRHLLPPEQWTAVQWG